MFLRAETNLCEPHGTAHYCQELLRTRDDEVEGGGAVKRCDRYGTLLAASRCEIDALGSVGQAQRLSGKMDREGARLSTTIAMIAR